MTASLHTRARTVAWITLGFAACAVLLTASNYRLSGDSSEYLTLANNVREGLGYTRVGQIEVYRQPGYPLITALLGLVIPSIELAGHVAALVCGVLCIPATWWTARAVLPPRGASLAAGLLAVNTFFADGASCALSETSCALFAILATGALWRALELDGLERTAVAAAFGALVAGAYLCRSEVLLLAPPGLLVLALQRRPLGLARIGAPLAAAAALALVCAPFWSRLHDAMGHFSLGGNSVNLIWYQSDIAERPAASLDPRWAPRELDPRYPTVTHPADFQPLRYALLNARELVVRFARNSATFVPPALSLLFFWLGAPLVFWGLARLRRSEPSRWLAIAIVPLVPLLALPFRDGTPRLLLPYLPVASIAMAAGFERVERSAVCARWLGAPGTRRRTATCILLLALAPAIKHARHVGRAEEWWRARYRAVGQAIRERTPPGVHPVVLAGTSVVGLHAGGDTLVFPARVTVDALVERMDSYGVSFLVVTRDEPEHLDEVVAAAVPVDGTPQLELVAHFPGAVDLYRRRDEQPRSK